MSQEAFWQTHFGQRSSSSFSWLWDLAQETRWGHWESQRWCNLSKVPWLLNETLVSDPETRTPETSLSHCASMRAKRKEKKIHSNTPFSTEENPQPQEWKMLPWMFLILGRRAERSCSQPAPGISAGRVARGGHALGFPLSHWNKVHSAGVIYSPALLHWALLNIAN